jgi:hypothetical protein
MDREEQQTTRGDQGLIKTMEDVFAHSVEKGGKLQK